MSRRSDILSGLREQNQSATFDGMTGFWCQSDCVLVEAESPQQAITAYHDKVGRASIAVSHNHFCASILLCKANDRIAELEAAIKQHRDQKLDDRCWLDDQKLYAVLKDGNTGDNSTPPMDAMLANCKRFLEKRCSPGDWKTYQELETENAKLRKQLEDKK
jgi:hypothetical protein